MSIKLTRELIDKVVTIIEETSRKIECIAQRKTAVSIKEDGSPLTQADLIAHRYIIAKLATLAPNIPIISEENSTRENTLPTPLSNFWLVDPLDGTKEFIRCNGEFTVNIALIQHGEPVLGVVSVPALKTIYMGYGNTAFKIDASGNRQRLNVSKPKDSGVLVVGSRSHGNRDAMERYLAQYQIKAFVPTGSSLKFCKIAEGNAHLYPRFGRTMEWDTAAGHAVLKAAGGEVKRLNGAPLSYGKPLFVNPYFVASC